VQTRRQQLLAYLDERGATLAKAFAAASWAARRPAEVLEQYRRERSDAFEAAREAALEIEHLRIE